MVKQGDFKVELVEATTKAPFKEHRHYGKTYVEVEPESEYFIALSKPHAKALSEHLLIVPYVDGQVLGYSWNCSSRKIFSNPRYLGSGERNNGVSIIRALKFVVAKTRAGPSLEPSNDNVSIGKVELKVFQALNPPQCKPSLNTSNKHKALSAHVNSQTFVGGKAKKSVRTALSETSPFIAGHVPEYYTKYDSGALLSTITLYYCTTRGLIQMGAIPAYNPSAGATSAGATLDTKNASRGIVKKNKESKHKRPLQATSMTVASSPTHPQDNHDDDDDAVVSVRESKTIKLVDLTACDDSDNE